LQSIADLPNGGMLQVDGPLDILKTNSHVIPRIVVNSGIFRKYHVPALFTDCDSVLARVDALE
jgi:hypothetical protein